jgi:hypothetical protein
MKTLHYSIMGISVLIVSSVMFCSPAYAPCMEGGGISCNNYPSPSLSQIKTDKINYELSDKPIITIIGVPNTVAHLEIDDPSSNIIFTQDINLSSNGTVKYVLDISFYKPGVYSAIATSLISKLTTDFAVGLATTGPIVTLNVLKDMYVQGDFITIVGTVAPDAVVKLSLIDPNDNVVTSIQTVSNDIGQYSTSALRIPTNAISGIWKITVDHNISHTTIKIMVQSSAASNVLKNIMTSPLKQFKSGITANNVECKQDLHLVIKSEDNSPACVKLDAAYMLIKRGWATSESAYPGGDAQFVLDTNSTIIPAHLPRSSGLRIPYYEPSRIINYSGFDGVYNETFLYRGTQNDYILNPGSTGIITFKLEAVVSEQQDQSYPIPLPKSLNLTNYAIFYHEITSLADLSKYPGVTFSDNSHQGGFTACSTGPAGGGTCIGGSSEGKNSIEAFVTDHPGVDVLFEPPSEILPLSMNAISHVVTMTITADSNAPRGTYLVMLPSVGVDSFLLTVGDKPYHE